MLQVLLIGLPYRYLCWERAETSNEQTASECLPCIFLQFPVSAVRGLEQSTNTQVLQIFSREVSSTVICHRLFENVL